jgi:hypothetical protein
MLLIYENNIKNTLESFNYEKNCFLASKGHNF